MCGRYAFFAELRQLIEYYSIDHVVDEPQNNYNVAPTDPVTIIVNNKGKRECRSVRWGLLPNWLEESKLPSYPLINARSESLASNGLFRESYKKRRCIIVASGFYEWKQAGKSKAAFFIRWPDKRPLSFAGIYDFRKQSNGNFLASCTIITTKANQQTNAIHDRLPVILQSQESEKNWINNSIFDDNYFQHLFDSDIYEALLFHQVSPAVGNIRNNNPELIAEIP
ncbi:MAG: SOS response-associated peptidase [Calditrichaeota bacterium]|nr:SOS response-associated peptidase [Calditrichota bacterium]